MKNQNPEGMNMRKLSGVMASMRSIVNMKQTGNFQVGSSAVTKTVMWRGKILRLQSNMWKYVICSKSDKREEIFKRHWWLILVTASPRQTERDNLSGLYQGIQGPLHGFWKIYRQAEVHKTDGWDEQRACSGTPQVMNNEKLCWLVWTKQGKIIQRAEIS